MGPVIEDKARIGGGRDKIVRRRAADEIVMRGTDNGSAGRDVTFDLDATSGRKV